MLKTINRKFKQTCISDTNSKHNAVKYFLKLINRFLKEGLTQYNNVIYVYF